MKKMSSTDSTQSTKRRSEILMIASGENAATSLTETSNPLTVRDREAIAGIHSK